MIAHAEYHATYPLPYGTMLPPTAYPVTHIDPDLIARRPNPPDPSETYIYPEAKFHGKNGLPKRIERYLPMKGKGWMTVLEISILIGSEAIGDTCRQQLLLLMGSGHVARQSTSPRKVKYKWL